MKILKESGNYLETKADENKKMAYIFFIICGIGLIYFLSQFTINFTVIFLVPVALVIFLKIFTPIFKIGHNFSNRASNYRSGIEGEKLVNEALSILDDTYFLINDIKLPDNYGNVDHIVLGKNGIFVIETKNYSGQIVCNGDDWIKHYEGNFLDSNRDYNTSSPSKQVKRNAVKIKQIIETSKILRKSLNIWVEGIVVFTNSNIELQLTDNTVPILKIDELSNYIKNKKSKTNFSPQELDSIGKMILRADKNILC